MHLYKVGYGSYEDSGDVTLSHEKLFSKEEFNKMAVEASVAVVRKAYAREDGSRWSAIDDLSRSDSERYPNHELHSFSDIYWDVAKEMCEMFGFKEVKFAAGFFCFGWASIFDQADWDSDRDDELKAVTAALNAAGFDKSHDRMVRHDLRRDEERKLEQEAKQAAENQSKQPPPEAPADLRWENIAPEDKP
jgi:hypothetical protein